MIPVLGEVIAGDWKSYQYLVESIRKFPDQVREVYSLLCPYTHTHTHNFLMAIFIINLCIFLSEN